MLELRYNRKQESGEWRYCDEKWKSTKLYNGMRSGSHIPRQSGFGRRNHPGGGVERRGGVLHDRLRTAFGRIAPVSGKRQAVFDEQRRRGFGKPDELRLDAQIQGGRHGNEHQWNHFLRQRVQGYEGQYFEDVVRGAAKIRLCDEKRRRAQRAGRSDRGKSGVKRIWRNL